MATSHGGETFALVSTVMFTMALCASISVHLSPGQHLSGWVTFWLFVGWIISVWYAFHLREWVEKWYRQYRRESSR